MKCTNVLQPKLNDSLICNKEAVYILSGNSFCEECGNTLLQLFGNSVAQQELSKRIVLPQTRTNVVLRDK